MTVSCNRNSCDRTWSRDPVLEVDCPTCSAGVGTKCKRPSGHGGNFVHPHAARDRRAVEDGHYGTCPLGICAETLADMSLDADAESEQTTTEDAESTQSSKQVAFDDF